MWEFQSKNFFFAKLHSFWDVHQPGIEPCVVGENPVS